MYAQTYRLKIIGHTPHCFSSNNHTNCHQRNISISPVSKFHFLQSLKTSAVYACCMHKVKHTKYFNYIFFLNHHNPHKFKIKPLTGAKECMANIATEGCRPLHLPQYISCVFFKCYAITQYTKSNEKNNLVEENRGQVWEGS